MLPNTGYFRSYPCPFFTMGFCERPHCHFSHKRESPPSAPGIPPSSTVQSEHPVKTEYIEEEDNKVSLKSESKEDVKSLSLAPALESSVASSLAAIDATAAGGVNLKQLVEEAVKKVLLESGAGAGVHNLVSSPRIKEEKHDSDDDVCIIEDNFKKEPDPEPAIDPTSSSTSGVSPPSLGRHKLYLPPDNCPQYKPTPLLQLQSRRISFVEKVEQGVK